MKTVIQYTIVQYTIAPARNVFLTFIAGDLRSSGRIE